MSPLKMQKDMLKVLLLQVSYQNKNANQENKNIFFHLTCRHSHPNNEINQTWRALVAKLLGKCSLCVTTKQTNEQSAVLQKTQQQKAAEIHIVLLGFDIPRPVLFLMAGQPAAPVAPLSLKKGFTELTNIFSPYLLPVVGPSG